MNPDPIYERLREIGWRRPLTPVEQAELRLWLAAHPEHRSDAEADFALSQALAKLPDAPMPSNFTARVLQAIDRDAQALDRAARPDPAPWWRLMFPKFAVATVVVGVVSVAYWRNQTVNQKELVDAAQSFVEVAGTGPLSDPSVLEDFDVIRRMSQADEGLLALSDDLLSLKQ